jgi:hypothetical protein
MMDLAARHEEGMRWSVHAAAVSKTEPHGRFPDTARLVCEGVATEHVHSFRGMPISYAKTIGELRAACPMASFSTCPECFGQQDCGSVR